MYPTFYFRPLPHPLTLSYLYNIQLRNPTIEELPIFQVSIKNLSNRLSDKERRRVLYTLFPLGNFSPEGTVEEQFIRELSKIWVIAYSEKKLPFEQGLVDYGFLCGYISDQQHLRNPGGFVCDLNNLSPRVLLRALKKELPKAAAMILSPSLDIPDLKLLIEQATCWDGILTHAYLPQYVQLAKTLRIASQTTDFTQKFLNYCITAEILLVHNPNSKSDSKMPMNRQFTSKLTLVRHMMIKLKKQSNLYTVEGLHEIFSQLYELRSQLIHGRAYNAIPKRKIAQYLNLLYPTIRLSMELQMTDPLFMEFIKKI